MFQKIFKKKNKKKVLFLFIYFKNMNRLNNKKRETFQKKVKKRKENYQRK